MINRNAFTLTELLITMTAGSSLMMLAVGLLHQTMHLTVAARGRADEHRTLSRLATQFRQDVHLADEVVVESSDTVRISSQDRGVVTYVALPSGCDRSQAGEVAASDKPAESSREHFALLPGGSVLFEMLEQPSRVRLTLYRGKPRHQTTERKRVAGEMPVDRRPPALQVEAVVGRMADIVRPHAEEDSP